MINLELFSCAGGMAEGFRRAGVTFDIAIDFAPDHCDSYEANLGHRPIIESNAGDPALADVPTHGVLVPSEVR